MILGHSLAATVVLCAGALVFEPQILTLEWPDGHKEQIAATSPETCQAAVAAIADGLWRFERIPRDLENDATGPDRIAGGPADIPAAWCAPGNLFDSGSQFIKGFNR